MSRRLVATRASAVPVRRMRFLADPWLPLGEVALIAGEPGLGKSALVVHYAARASRGELPGDLAGTPIDVLIAGTEKSREATVVPRLLAAGANLDRVHFLDLADNGRPAALAIPDDLDEIEHVMREVGARLATFDPLSAFLAARVNSWREHDVRRALVPFADVARRLDAVLVGVAHLNKGESDKLLQRVGGSIGFGAAVRSVVAFGRDPSDPDGPRGRQRVIAHAKCNVAAEADPLGAELRVVPVTLATGETVHTTALHITGGIDVEADELLSSRDEWSARDDAAQFLRAELANGPVPTKELQRLAQDAGLSWRTVERAKSKVGARARKEGAGGWVWELPGSGGGEVDGVGGLQVPTEHPNSAKSAKNAKNANHSAHGTPDADAELARLTSNGGAEPAALDGGA